MYDCTARPTSTGEEIPQCHNLHATVKNIITRSFANMPPDSVLDGTGAECNSSLSNHVAFENEQVCTQGGLDLVQLSLQDMGFSEFCADLTGCLDQRAVLPEVVSPGMWDSRLNYLPTVGAPSLPRVHTTAHLNHHASSRRPTTTQILSTLPLLSSYAYLEPTFSRRLVRLL